MEVRTKGRKVQKEICIILRTKELIILRLNPFLWFYFNIGKYENKWKRVAFDFCFELRGQIYGFSWEKEV